MVVSGEMIIQFTEKDTRRQMRIKRLDLVTIYELAKQSKDGQKHSLSLAMSN